MSPEEEKKRAPKRGPSRTWAVVAVACCVLAFAASVWWVNREEHFTPYASVGKTLDGKGPLLIHYSVHFDGARRETYFDYRPFGSVDEIHIATPEGLLHFCRPSRGNPGPRLRLTPGMEKRFQEVKQLVEGSVDVEKLPGLDLSRTPPANRNLTPPNIPLPEGFRPYKHEPGTGDALLGS